MFLCEKQTRAVIKEVIAYLKCRLRLVKKTQKYQCTPCFFSKKTFVDTSLLVKKTSDNSWHLDLLCYFKMYTFVFGFCDGLEWTC